MIQAALAKLFGTKNERTLKALQPTVAAINALEPEMRALSDAALRGKTAELRERLERMTTTGGMTQAAALDALLPEAFAVVREAARRTLGMRPYDVQLIGGIVLHQGKIAEMKTGEGKTLVATMPLYLNALTNRGVHLVTVNDYLARRDAEWMGKVYRFLGMSVGVITHDLDTTARQRAYAADITYGTNNEFGFDYLRDNMKYNLADYVQRDLHFAIIDEVDSILIDEARTPLIISGAVDQKPELYKEVDRYVKQLIREEQALGTDPTANPKESDNPGRYYHVDLEHKSVVLTEEGVARMEELTKTPNLFAPSAIEMLHHVQQSLRANTLYQRDVDYVVRDGEVVIVDEFTGRLMHGRRWSDGLHQAVEAKEGVKIESENQTLATITFQNFFKMYEKLGGMTGTAETEAAEFHSIYKLDVVVIPTNRPIQRHDEADLVFKREAAKFKAIAEKIKELHDKGAPVLVGTTSIEKSERIYNALIRQGIAAKKVNVLNAKQHEREAEIIAQAGQSGAITIATNMAGRGTDIVLGGNPEYLAWRLLLQRGFDHTDLKADQFIKFLLLDDLERARELAADDDRLDEDLIAQILEHRDACKADQAKVIAAGGLHIIGTERHESRRVDNQLRGRAGRQGDPGWSQFFLSLEDDLIHIFGGERILNLMHRLGMGEDDAIQHPWLSRAIENAQQKVEARNFEIRKNLLDYDDVMNQQRKVVYAARRQILAGEQLDELLDRIVDEACLAVTERCAPPKTYPEGWDWDGVRDALAEWGITAELPGEDTYADWRSEDLADYLTDTVRAAIAAKRERFGAEAFGQILRFVMLQTLDQLWKDHLLAMDQLREGIGLRGYGQRDPKREYAREGLILFEQMLDLFRFDVVRKINLVELRSPEEQRQAAELERRLRERPQGPMQFEHASQTSYGVATSAASSSLPAATPIATAATGGGLVGAATRSGPQAAVRPAAQPSATPQPRHVPRAPGRNDPCPCGSGKKYKKCHWPEYG